MVPTRDISKIRRVLERSAHFRDLPTQTLDHMANAARIQRLVDKQLLRNHHADLGLWVVLSGALQVSILSASGAAATIAILGQGSFLGLNSVFGSCITRVKECRAVGSTAVAAITQVALNRMVDHDDAFRTHAMQLVVSRLNASLSALADVTNAPLSQRLARRLLGQMLAAGELAAGQVVEIRLTQRLMAQLLGASRSSVSEELRNLERAGVVRSMYRGLRVVDVERLHEIAGPGVIAI